jgi:hypothetical protein
VPKIQLKAENYSAGTWQSSVEGVAAFSLENNGTVSCEVAFDAAAPTWVPVHPGMAREFVNIGDSPYTGRVLGRFAAGDGTRLISIVKSLVICP